MTAAQVHRGGLAAVLVLVLALLLPAPVHAAVVDAWPGERGGPGRTGHNPAERALSTDTVAGLRRQWRSSGLSSLATSAVGGGVAYATATNPGRVVAVDAVSGRSRWVWQLPHGGHAETPVVGGPLVYVGVTGERTDPSGAAVYALRAADGSVVWRHSEAEAVGQPTSVGEGTGVLGDGRLYVSFGSDEHGRVIALDARTGQVRWARDADELGVNGGMANAYSGGRLFLVGRSRNCVHALDGRTGERATRYDCTYLGDIRSVVAVGAQIYVTQTDVRPSETVVWAFPTSCAVTYCPARWRADVEGHPGTLAAARGLVYVPTTTTRSPLGPPLATLTALDPRTGRSTWTASTVGHTRVVSVAGDVAYLAANAVHLDGVGRVALLDADGCGAATCRPLRMLRAHDGGSAVYEVAVAGGTAVLNTGSGMSAFRLR